MNGHTDTEARRAARKEAGNLTFPLLLFLLLPRVLIVANGTQSALALEARRADMEAEYGMDTEARRAAVKCVRKFAFKNAHHLQNVANGTVVEAKRAARRAAGTIGVGVAVGTILPLGGTIIIGVAARKEARRAVVLASEAVPNACLSAILPL